VSSLALFAPGWGVYAAFQPDLVYWLYAVALILLAKGLVETRSIASGQRHPDLRGHS
jgi:hypothetical protein